MRTRKVILGDCVEELKKIKSETIDLVVADPPYWKVVGESWDYQWRTEADYIAWSLQWIEEISRALRKGGTFYIFGYFRTLAHLVPHLEKYSLELRQQIILDKGMRSVSGRATKNYKIFPNVTESILMIVKDSKPFIKEILKKRQKALGLSSKEINERLGVKSNGGGMWSIYTGENICEQVPTLELWLKLQEVLEFNYPYEKLTQTFNAQMGFTDVWRDIDFYSEERFHKTQKPVKLIRRLIDASSNPGDLVLDPFAGSGSTAIAAEMANRNYITFDDSKAYIKIVNDRLERITNPLKTLISV